MYKLQVIVDGTRVFHGLFDVASKWPQEISHEAKAIGTAEHPTSHHKSNLLFPSFDPETLFRTEWDCHDPGGRINVILSEQLVAKTSSPTEADLGPFHEIVCFSFQHAPKDSLERAGISWPIRNPLFMPSLSQDIRTTPRLSHPSLDATRMSQLAPEHQKEPLSRSAAHGPRIIEPLQRPNSHPSLARISHPTTQSMDSARARFWDNSPELFGDFREEGTSLDPWSLRRSMSPSRGNPFIKTRVDPFSHTQRSLPLWTNSSHEQESSANREWPSIIAKIEKDIPVSVAHQEDRFGQVSKFKNPSMTQRNPHHSLERQFKSSGDRTWKGKLYTTPTAGSAILGGHNPTDDLARKPSWTKTVGSLRPVALRAPPGPPKAVGTHPGMTPSSFPRWIASNKENHPRSPIQVLPHWDPDMSARDESSMFSNFSRQDLDTLAHLRPRSRRTVNAPLNNGSVKSRKEGIAQRTLCSSEHESRHDQTRFPPTSFFKRSTTQNVDVDEHDKGTAAELTPKTTNIEIIDVDAIDQPPDPKPSSGTSKPSPAAKSFHKAGMSSLDSTERLEQKLYSALGEELASFDSHDHTDMSQGLAEALHLDASQPSGNATSVTHAREPEHVSKRKRHAALGCDSHHQSPTSKREKSGQADVDE